MPAEINITQTINLRDTDAIKLATKFIRTLLPFQIFVRDAINEKTE